MRAVVQRVESARVIVDGRVTGEIGAGLAVLVAVGKNDVSATCCFHGGKNRESSDF